MKHAKFLVLGILALSFASSAEARNRYNRYEAASQSTAQDRLPPCFDSNGAEVREGNNDVLKWKENTQNQYKDRALVTGKIVRVLQERRSHQHIEIDLVPQNGDRDRGEHLEVIYNREFGDITKLTPGLPVAVCGDYITARDRAGNYPPSPVGAIIHWVHASNDLGRHKSGYVVVDGTLFGFEGDGAGRRPEER